uniref:G-protein coupled receptors family 1 profile domain-containing protein n=1 Tax=Plectus sambesii TaxID=2011161 RepID=A0A914WRR5_9BILA
MVYFDLSLEYVLFGCFCVSVPLYIFVLVNLALVPKSDAALGSSFFRIVLSTGIADVLTAIQTYAYFKFRFWNVAFDFYSTIHPVLKYDLIISYATTFVQSFGNLLLGFNRYTAMVMPTRHAVIWSSERVRIYLIAKWLIACVIVIPGIFLELSDLTFNRVPDDGNATVNGVATATLQLLMVLQGFNKWYRAQAVAVDAANYIHPYFLLSLSAALRNRCFPCISKEKRATIAPIEVQPISTVEQPSIINHYRWSSELHLN